MMMKTTEKPELRKLKRPDQEGSAKSPALYSGDNGEPLKIKLCFRMINQDLVHVNMPQ